MRSERNISYAEAVKVVQAETIEALMRAGMPGLIGMQVGPDVESRMGENTRMVVDMRKVVTFVTAAINCTEKGQSKTMQIQIIVDGAGSEVSWDHRTDRGKCTR